MRSALGKSSALVVFSASQSLGTSPATPQRLSVAVGGRSAGFVSLGMSHGRAALATLVRRSLPLTRDRVGSICSRPCPVIMSGIRSLAVASGGTAPTDQPLQARVSRAELVQETAFVNGKFGAGSASGKTFEVLDPASGAVLGRVPDMDAAASGAAIDAATAAFSAWRSVPAKEKGVVLRRWYDLIIANTDDLAIIMTSECGKPLAESKGEVAYAASFVDFFAEEARRIEGTRTRCCKQNLKGMCTHTQVYHAYMNACSHMIACNRTCMLTNARGSEIYCTSFLRQYLVHTHAHIYYSLRHTHAHARTHTHKYCSYLSIYLSMISPSVSPSLSLSLSLHICVDTYIYVYIFTYLHVGIFLYICAYA